MPGLIGCVVTAAIPVRDILNRMLATVMYGSYHIAYAYAVRGAFACVHHGHFDHAVVAVTDDQRIGVVLDGWLFGWKDKIRKQNLKSASVDAVHYCLNTYLEYGIDFVKQLNGQFNLLVWDDRSFSIYLINDRYGTRPLQYASPKGALYFSPEGKAILGKPGISGQLNLRMVVNQLSWGRIWLGQETLFQDILVLPPASILHWQDGHGQLDQYWDYIYTPAPNIDDDFIDHTFVIFQQAMERQTRAPLRYGVSLSGGLDSRAVLATLTQQHAPEVKAYSWGVSDVYDEVAIARCVADRLGVPWHYIPLTPMDYIAQASRGAFLSEGLDLHVQSFGLKSYPIIQQQADVLLTGLALDLTLGGSYLHPSLLTGEASSDIVLRWVLQKSTLFSPEECQQLLRLNDTGAILEDLGSEVIHLCQTGPNDHPANQSDRFFLRCRAWRYTFLRQFWQRLFVEDIAPTFDNEFIDCLLQIPPAWRIGHRFYQRFLQRLECQVMDIPYQATMLPPATPLQFWAIGMQLEQQRETLYRDIWYATQGQIFIPYQRFSTNYDEWLRCDPYWISVTDDLLLSVKSVSCDRLLNRQVVDRLVTDHRLGKAANHRQILQLMTLELFLRQFFN